MKVTPKPNIQQSQVKIVDRIRTMFFNGKVKLRTLLRDVFEKETSKKLSKEEIEKYDEYLKRVLPYYINEMPSEIRDVPSFARTDVEIEAARAWCPKYLNEADKNHIFSIKDVKERNALLDKWLKEGRATYDY